MTREREKGAPELDASMPPRSALDFFPAAKAILETYGPRDSEMPEADWEPARISDLDVTLNPPSAAPSPRLEARVRLPGVKRIERESGKTVASITVAPDGAVTYTFGKPEAAKEAAPAEEPRRTTLFKARLVPKKKVVL